MIRNILGGVSIGRFSLIVFCPQHVRFPHFGRSQQLGAFQELRALHWWMFLGKTGAFFEIDGWV